MSREALLLGEMVRDKMLARLANIPGVRTMLLRFPLGSVDTRVEDTIPPSTAGV